MRNDERLGAELADFYERQKKYDEAIEQYKKVLAVNPHYSLAVNNLASILVNYRSDQQSLTYAKELMARYELSGRPVFLDTLGWIYYKLGDDSKAIELLTRSVKLAPDVPHFHYHLGMAYFKSDKNKARLHLAKALEFNLNFPGRDEAVQAIMAIH